jgi:TolA-binding protein
LAKALILEGKAKEAQAPAAASLKLAKDPASRAKALLVSASVQHSLKNIPSSSSMVEEAMLLQPEGPINAEARLLSGDLLASKQDYAGAAKAYMTVAVLSDDASLAPKALARSADAYHRANNEEEARKALDELHKRFPNISATPKP